MVPTSQDKIAISPMRRPDRIWPLLWLLAGCVMLVFAALGYLMSSFGYPLVIVIIAFFLGPRLEVSIAQSLALTRGDPAALIDHPVAIALLLLSVVSVVYLVRRTRQLDG